LIEERANALGFSELREAVAEISEHYRNDRPARLNDGRRTAAYLVTRMPATYAAAHAVLRELRDRLGPIGTILDIGAGTGAASLAARECFPDTSITMIERDTTLSEAARLLLPDAEIVMGDLKNMPSLPAADLVIAVYSLGECGAAVARRMWTAARIAVIVVEPGTPRGFSLIRSVREDLLALSAHLAAPCPTAGPCPILVPDWCHFAARVERSSLHRRVKGGEIGYEDEKYSYVAFTRRPVAMAAARIIRRPAQSPGLITLATCRAGGLTTERVRKRDREAYRAARHAAWGDPWD